MHRYALATVSLVMILSSPISYAQRSASLSACRNFQPIRMEHVIDKGIPNNPHKVAISYSCNVEVSGGERIARYTFGIENLGRETLGIRISDTRGEDEALFREIVGPRFIEPGKDYTFSLYTTHQIIAMEGSMQLSFILTKGENSVIYIPTFRDRTVLEKGKT